MKQTGTKTVLQQICTFRSSSPVPWSCLKGAPQGRSTAGTRRRISSSGSVNGGLAGGIHPSFTTQKRKMVDLPHPRAGPPRPPRPIVLCPSVSRSPSVCVLQCLIPWSVQTFGPLMSALVRELQLPSWSLCALCDPSFWNDLFLKAEVNEHQCSDGTQRKHTNK